MNTAAGTLSKVEISAFRAWAPALLLPLAAALVAAAWPPWASAWLVAAAFYFGLKWLSLCLSPAGREVGLMPSIAYLLLWPGMDAQAFLAGSSPSTPHPREALAAIAKLAAGLILIFAVSPRLNSSSPLMAAWVGMAGIALTLLFGLPHLLSVAWRYGGINAQPIMNRPLAARSLSDFWSNRWNLAFRDAGRLAVFQPLVGRFGVAPASLAVFLVSGVIHDAVMSLPPRGGLGLPTLYFLLQGVAVLCERSRLGASLGLGRGLRGRLYAAVIILLPLTWLFHRPFLEHVVQPTLRTLTAT